MDDVWLTHGKLITPRGIVGGAVRIARGRIAAISPRAPRGAAARSLHGRFLAPGFIDLHVWGNPWTVSREAVAFGTTAFLAAVGPEPPKQLTGDVEALAAAVNGLGHAGSRGARCLGLHLEGPFLNPARAGALPARWMRRPTGPRLRAIARAADGRVKLMTVAPELPGAMDAIRRWAARGVVISLGHSDADHPTASRAALAGARAVTHVFNGMRPFHHRAPSLVDAALGDPRLAAMVIADGVHVGATALRLLLRTKGPSGVALVTDSVRHQRRAWKLSRRRGAYYTRRGTLAGSALTMMGAVRHAVQAGRASLSEAVEMASTTPARLIGAHRRLGSLDIGKRADLVCFDRTFRVRWTMVDGTIVYSSGSVR